MYYDLILLAAIVVFIVDISGVIHSLKESVGRFLRLKIDRLRPFDCSLCMVWWSGLAYLLAVGRFELKAVAFVALLAAFSVQIGGLIQLMRGLVQWIIDFGLQAFEK